jgi:hypothetical protein
MGAAVATALQRLPRRADRPTTSGDTERSVAFGAPNPDLAKRGARVVTCVNA